MAGTLSLGRIWHSRVVGACRGDSNIPDVENGSNNAEEVKLLTEEMSRTINFFGHYRKLWMGYADEDEREGRDGGAAYARK